MDYRDYIRGKNTDFDLISYDGRGACKKVEYIDIRGNSGMMITVPFWQSSEYTLHMDCEFKVCEFDCTPGAVKTEDAFGFYDYTNPAFRCTENQNGTTQIWFGDYV